jgi:uncharacterized surface anchored protein
VGQIVLERQNDGWFRITELAPKSGYTVKGSATQDVYVEAGRDKTVTFENTPKSAIIIRKIDSETGRPVSGATFTVRYLGGTSGSSGTIIHEGMTSASGIIVLAGLAPGTYVCEETRANPAYELSNPSVQTAYISGEEQDVVELVFADPKMGGLIIKKLDSVTKQPIKDVTFKVTDSSGGVIGPSGGEYTTDADGVISIAEPLPIGSAVVVNEIRCPSNYTMDENEQSVKIKENTVHTLTFYNTPKSVLRIVKLDSATKMPVADVTFRVTDSGGAVIGASNGEYTTDANGVIEVGEWLTPGTTVTVTEIRCPDTHNMDAPPQSVKIAGNTTHTLTFYDSPKSGLQIVKIDSVSKQPIKGAKFALYKKSGDLIGEYETDTDGLIIIPTLDPGWVKIVETWVDDHYTRDETPKDAEIRSNQFIKVVFENTPKASLQIIKLDEETRRPIPNVEFAVARMNGERIGVYTTDAQGCILINDLGAGGDGWFTVTETKAGKDYLIDPTPRNIEVRDGKTSVLTVTNSKASGIFIRKVDSVMGKGVYGVKFLISDADGKPLITVESDQNGYVYLPGIPDGKYFIREIEANGYVPDTEVKTFYVRYGSTAEITWKNTPVMGQIQITKKSADDNPINGFPEGTPLQGAVFEIYDRANNLMDTVTSDKNGLAVSKTLPLGRYTIREVKAPDYYSAVKDAIDAEIEFSGQIVRLTVLNTGVYTNVSVTKRGYTEVVPGQSIRYDFRDIANNSTVPLDSFYWRDTLPTDAVRLDKIITGTWSARLSYKIVYKTNLSGGATRMLADNLSTDKSRTIAAGSTALGLASNEYVTEFMFVFGRVPAGFSQVDAPYIYCDVLPGLAHEYRFTNKTDVGGLWGDRWIQTSDRWVTVVYNMTAPPRLPRTGF